MSRKSKYTRTPAVNSREERAKKIIPVLLQDPSAEGGIAHLEACYFQRMKEPGQKIRHFQVGIPQQWLIESLMMKEEQSRNNPKKINSIWREFAALPDDYRDAITDVLANTEGSHRGDDHPWDMIFAECIRKPRFRGFFFWTGDDNILGVWVIWKKRNHHLPLKLGNFNPHSDTLDVTKPLVQANDHTQHSVLCDVTNSGRARITPHPIAQGGSRTRTESKHSTREREREWKRRERDGKTENNGYRVQELGVRLDRSNSSLDVPYDFRDRSVRADRGRRRDSFHRGEPPWEPYLDSESDSAKGLAPRTARRAHRGRGHIDRGFTSPDDAIFSLSRDRRKGRRDALRPRKPPREPDPDFESVWRATSPLRTTRPTNRVVEIVDRSSVSPNTTSSNLPRDFRVGTGDSSRQDKWSLDNHVPGLRISRIRSISPVESYALVRMPDSEYENSSEEDGSNTQYLQDNRKETDEVVIERLLRSYTNPDANISVIEEPYVTTEEPSESSIPTRGDNGDTAAKTEERNQLADKDLAKGSFSADTSAGLEMAKHVRMKAEVDVIPDRAYLPPI